ncbi:MAG TPA: substrate-binding domain-containing protein [Castellaniella sp.]
MSTEPETLKGISSMATQHLLAQLADQYVHEHPVRVQIESVGGVKAEKRVLEDEPFDFVILASGAMERLAAAGKIDRDSLVGVVSSSIAVATRLGLAAPDVHSEDSIRDAVRNARTVGYSTGPSGQYILRLLEKWGIPTGSDARQPQMVEARPGVPVGSLVASGEVDIGFQQISELIDVEGINLLGLLPDPIQKTTVFSAAIASSSHRQEATRAFLRFLVSPATEPAKKAHGMSAA